MKEAKPMRFSLILLSAMPFFLSAQSVLFEGRISNKNNGNYLPDAVVTVYDDKRIVPIGEDKTDDSGNYHITVPKRDRYRIEVKKSTYFKADKVIPTDELGLAQDFALSNKPGYLFDITIFDKADKHTIINSLRDCKVEIYNNTTKEQELTIPRHPKSVFNFPFNEGNHYTVLVRKQGYINRRIEAYVNVNGCILCIDGMGVSKPDVVHLMSNNNETGYFLGNIDLDSIHVGRKFVIPNIYYDYDKWFIRPEAAKVLDKLAIMLKDNPAIKVELGSHTDVRGRDPYNLKLSDRRAESAVKYLVEVCGVHKENITWRGYGETEIVNRCANKVKCSEEEHQMNRRTELKILGYSEKDPLWDKSLKEIIEDKDLYKKILKQEKAGTGQPATNLEKVR